MRLLCFVTDARTPFDGVAALCVLGDYLASEIGEQSEQSHDI